jgi:hypothetical protein
MQGKMGGCLRGKRASWWAKAKGAKWGCLAKLEVRRMSVVG